MMDGMMGCMGTRKKQDGEKGKGRWGGWRRVENESRKGSKREAKEVKGARNQGKGYDQGKCKEKPCTLCHERWSLSQHSCHTHTHRYTHTHVQKQFAWFIFMLSKWLSYSHPSCSCIQTRATQHVTLLYTHIIEPTSSIHSDIYTLHRNCVTFVQLGGEEKQGGKGGGKRGKR